MEVLPNTRLSRLHFISVRAVQMPQPRQASGTPRTSASTWRHAGHVWALQSASSCGCPPVAGPDPEANGQSHPAVPCLDGSRCVGWQGGAATSVRSKALPPPPTQMSCEECSGLSGTTSRRCTSCLATSWASRHCSCMRTCADSATDGTWCTGRHAPLTPQGFRGHPRRRAHPPAHPGHRGSPRSQAQGRS